MPGYSLYNHKKCKYKHTNTQLQTHKYTSTFIQVQISNIHTPKHEHICGKHEPLWSHRDAQAQRRVHTAAIFRLGALQNIYGAEPTSNVHGFCIFNPKLMYHPLIIQMAIVFVNKKTRSGKLSLDNDFTADGLPSYYADNNSYGKCTHF